MSQAVTSFEQLDLDISVAWIALGVARTAFERCPSAENERRVGEAEGSVDRLLDARFAAQQ
ncbi:hypothetical protein OF117_03245 [Geodermatophilus sp. YIM 151500]|uniref:hypothetical protein n=1 Tax=Geodermatophilus sp. YIM 151500 TaxID=2984531 RepID=UPI0021E475C2|nr:hypothetical protein [Geodermatophilus sp. YIM 151500]MCV2488366.1 hypothetical protein [Geodermatophilus sp. YIM 151500]